MAADTRIYLTRKRPTIVGPNIEAVDWSHAEAIAAERGLTLDGQHILTIQSNSMTSEKADQLMRDLAESIDIEVAE